MSLARPALGALLGLALVLRGASAFARDPAGAEALYRSAKEAAKRGDYDAACEKFSESERLDPAPGTLLNLADCEEHRGRLTTAWQLFVRVEPQFPRGDARGPFAHDHAAQLEKRLPRIVVKDDGKLPPDAKIFRDEEELGKGALGVALPVDPGAHTVLVRVGKLERRTVANAVEGQTAEVLAATPQADPEAPVPPAAAPVLRQVSRTPLASSDRAHDSGAPPAITWILLGTGGASLAVGAITGVVALSKASTVKERCGVDYLTCDGAAVDAADTGKTMSIVSTAGFVAGAALVAAGAYFLLTSRKSTQVTLSPRGALFQHSFR